MQKVVGVLLVVAALGLGAYAWMLSKNMATSRPAPMQQVVVAAQHMAAGDMLTADNLRLMDFPARPAGSYKDLASVVGKVTPVDIAAGEPLLAERIDGSAIPSLKRLEPDERAVAIKVDEVIAVGNRLAPGDLVDVFATFRHNNDEISASHARLLMGGLRVLAFGAHDTPGAAKNAKNTAPGQRAVADTPRTAVLAVPLADVDKLALAVEAGRLLLALRPVEPTKAAASGDPSITARLSAPSPASAQTVSLRELTGSIEIAKPRVTRVANKPAPARGTTVHVMHGLKEKAVQVSWKQNGAGQ